MMMTMMMIGAGKVDTKRSVDYNTTSSSSSLAMTSLQVLQASRVAAAAAAARQARYHAFHDHQPALNLSMQTTATGGERLHASPQQSDERCPSTDDNDGMTAAAFRPVSTARFHPYDRPL